MKAQIINNPVYWKKVEYTTAGTYTLTIPNSGKCKVIIVGGGGGGARAYWSGVGTVARTGGSGAMITGSIDLNAGDYTIVVGEAGTGAYKSGSDPTAIAVSGGDTSFNGNIAGGGAYARAHQGWGATNNSWNGDGGTATVLTTGLTGSNGTSGSTTSRYENYGGGGAGSSGTASQNNGQSGYAAFEFISDSSDYTYIVDNLTAKVYKKGNVYKAFK